MSKVLVDRELLPCPFCGQQDAFVEQLDSDASVVICQGRIDEYSACLARGPVGVQQSEMEDQPGRDAAIAEWNRRAQPAEAEGVERQRMIESMCLTWRHDFGLDAPAPGSLASGMTESGRQHLRGEMGKLFDHHFAPVLSSVTAERDRLREQCDLNDMVHGTKGRERVAALLAQFDQLRAEVEALRAQRDKMAQILRDLVPGCKWRFMRPRIDQALQEVDGGN